MTLRMRSHAIVVGAGIGGITFAEVLSRHFKRVTVLERDDLPNGPQERRFVPQGAHINGILVRGREALRELFPEWESKALSAGAVMADFGTDLKWITRNGEIQKFAGGSLESICCSRVFLEWAIRTELNKRKNVSIFSGVFVEGLSLSPDRGAIMGVKVRPGKHGLSAHLHADLVVESGGKGTHLPQWLAELGFGKVPVTTVESTGAYSCRRYRITRPERIGAKMLWVERLLPENLRSGALLPIEGGEHFAVLAGAKDQQPPSDEADFLDFARSLHHPYLYDILKDSTPTSPVRVYRGTTNRRREFEKLERWPTGLLSVGDSACAMNPFFGFGVTVAATQALALHEYLQSSKPVDRRAQNLMQKVAKPAWDNAAEQDSRLHGKENSNRASLRRKVYRALNQRLAAGRSQSPLLARVFLTLFNLKGTPRMLFRPDVLLALLRVKPPVPTAVAAPPPVSAPVTVVHAERREVPVAVFTSSV